MVRRIAPVRWLALLMGAVLFSAAPARAVYVPDERIPTDSPLYQDLENLVTRYGLRPGPLGLRPWRLAAVESVLAAVERAVEGEPEDPAYLRLAREVRMHAAGAAVPLISAREGSQYLELAPYARFEYVQDRALPAEHDRDARLGALGAFSPTPGTVGHLSLYAGRSSQGGHGTPRFGTEWALIEGQDFNTWVERAYLGWTLGGVQVLAGRDWLRWGPGWNGTLGLSDAARALDVLSFELPLLRVARAAWFVAVLDPGVQSYLAGQRLELDVGSLTLALAELARFNGTSQAPFYLLPGVPYSFWEKRLLLNPPAPGDTDVAFRRNNVLMTLDASWSVRPGLRLYGELVIDDYSFGSRYKPNQLGFQGGVHVHRALAEGRALAARAEYARVFNYTYSVWHGHHFEHQGFPLGYPLGPDVEDVRAQVSWQRGAALKLGLGAEWRRKGEGRLGDPWPEGGPNVDGQPLKGVVEGHARAGLELEWAPTAAWRAVADVGYLRLRNGSHVPSQWSGYVPFRLGVWARW